MKLILTDISECPEMLQQVHSLYTTSFPIEERRDWSELCDKLNDPKSGFKMTVATINGTFAGFITTWGVPNVVYVEHFAINYNHRGNGIGGKIIDEIVKSSQFPVVLEVELPETGEMAQRRIGFYERHGFYACPDYNYIQPSYETKLPLMPLMLMVTDRDMNLPDIARNIHVIAYGADVNFYNYL